MKTSAVLLAAPKSGSGKTTVACALMEALKRRGIPVSGFKCGPDYIDPMFHQKVIGVPSRNLDTFFSDDAQIRELFSRRQRSGGCSVIEGVMGLYDGLGGVRREGSAYHLAQVLDVAVVLVLDVKGMGRTVVPLLAGLLRDDADRRIIGVILNRTGASFGKTLAALIEKELGIAVLGCFPERAELMVSSRHLGLKLPDEIGRLREKMALAAQQLEETVDIDRLLELLGSFGEEAPAEKKSPGGEGRRAAGDFSAPRVRIAVAKDEAFCFYYEDNLRLLWEAGADLVTFSPLHDTRLPEGIAGILLGGGYPELVCRELSENASMREQIRRALAEGLPSVAECGGFMYLHEYIEDGDGRRWPMAGVIPGGCKNAGRLVRFGYVSLAEKKPLFLPPGEKIKGHEFHYFDSDENGADAVAQKPVGGKSWECVHAGEDHWWGFPHLYYPSNPKFAESFVAMCRRYRNGV